MITRSTIVKAVLFVVLTVGLVLYIGGAFLGLFSFFGAKPYLVQMPMGNASGIFPRAEITVRGVEVGAVKQLRLTRDGVTAELEIDGAAPPIPADLTAVVASRTAVGERFIDLRPNTGSGPFLTDGATIPAERVAVPIPVEDVLLGLDKLAADVPLDDLRTVVGELGRGFNGLGPKLQLLLDSTSSLTNEATANLPQTLALIRDTRTVLQTTNDLADPIKAGAADLREVAAQLKQSDGDIRRLLETGPDAAREISALLDESGDGLSDVISEGLTASYILRSRLNAVKHVLIGYPMLVALVPTLVPGDDTAHIGLAVNFDDPPTCTTGYESTVRRQGVNVVKPWPINYRAYCDEPIYDVTGVRDIKPQYPFKDGKPQRPPEWYSAFYLDGPKKGIFGDPVKARRDNTDFDRSYRRGRWQDAPPMVGLLNAPGQQGEFGLTSVLLLPAR